MNYYISIIIIQNSKYPPLYLESDGGSPVCDSPVLPHSHSAAPSGDPISWLPSVWLSSLYSIDNLDPSLLFILRFACNFMLGVDDNTIILASDVPAVTKFGNILRLASGGSWRGYKPPSQ